MNVLEARRRLLGAGVYKKTVTGNPAIAQGSLARMYPGIEMQGWTEQKSTTGANLIDYTKAEARTESQSVEIVDGGVKWTGDYYFIIPVTGLKKSQEYTMHYVSDNASNWLFAYTDGTYAGTVQNGKSAITDPEKDCDKVFIYKSNPNVAGQDMVFTDIMLNEGSTALPYEPYTGGAPSPSPEYPQDIVSAGKYDEASGKYEYGVEICGKNLFNPNGEHVSGLYLGFPINNKDTVSIAIYEKNSNIDVSGIFFGFTGNGINAEDGYDWVLIDGNIMSNGNTYYEPQNGYVSIYPPNKLETFLERYDVMLNDGRAVYPAYEPYKPPQTVTLTSDRPLTKWDKLTKKDGVWGWEYKSKEYVLNGNELCDDTWAPTMVVYIDDTDNYVAYNEPFYCNNFETVKVSNAIGSGFSINVVSYVDLQTVEGFKAFCAEKAQKGTPVIIWAEMIKETFVPLSETEQEQMNALHTNRPTTVLSNDADCEMTLTYKTRKSMEVTT